SVPAEGERGCGGGGAGGDRGDGCPGELAGAAERGAAGAGGGRGVRVRGLRWCAAGVPEQAVGGGGRGRQRGGGSHVPDEVCERGRADPPSRPAAGVADYGAAGVDEPEDPGGVEHGRGGRAWGGL